MDGAEIKQLREAAGLTQPELADALGVHKQTISNWETGNTVPKNRAGMIRRYFEDRGIVLGDPLRTFSDAAMLNELLRRAIARPMSDQSQ